MEGSFGEFKRELPNAKYSRDRFYSLMLHCIMGNVGILGAWSTIGARSHDISASAAPTKFAEVCAGEWQKTNARLVLMFVKRTSVNKSHIFVCRKGIPLLFLLLTESSEVKLTHTGGHSVCYTRALQCVEWEFGIISCRLWVITASNIQSLKTPVNTSPVLDSVFSPCKIVPT